MQAFQLAEAMQKVTSDIAEKINESFIKFDDEEVKKVVKTISQAIVTAEEEFNKATKDSAKILGHMCVLQSVHRDLEPGETRSALVSKCKKSFAKKKYLCSEPHMSMWLDQHA